MDVSDMMKNFVKQELDDQIKTNYPHMRYPPCIYEGTEKHTIFILTLIKKKKSIRVFMILVDFLLDKI